MMDDEEKKNQCGAREDLNSGSARAEKTGPLAEDSRADDFDHGGNPSPDEPADKKNVAGPIGVGARGQHYSSEEGVSGIEKGVAPQKASAFLRSKWAVLVAVGAAALLALIWFLFATHIICFHENWAEATCDEPRTCVDCGTTEGEPLGHEWIEATCTKPKTCMRCGATEGEAIGHKAKGWSTPSVDIVSATETSTLTCEVCGEVVDEQTDALTSFVKDNKFIFSPSDFCARLRNIADMEAIDGGDADLISYALTESIRNPEMCAMLSFSSMDGETTLGEAYKHDSACNPSPILMVDTGKTNSAELMIAFVRACDPSLSRSDAINVASALADSIGGTSGSTEKNGIEYLLVGIDHRVMFRAVIK